MPILVLAAFPLLIFFAPASFAQSQVGQSQSHAEHAMGFSQTATAHHFCLRKDGGIIQVESISEDDVAAQNHIRMHLQHIAKSFAEGDFADPMEVHDEVPPGVPALKKLKNKISYRYESIPKGARVTIRTGDPEALSALHEFLRYQIREHHTGDPFDP